MFHWWNFKIVLKCLFVIPLFSHSKYLHIHLIYIVYSHLSPFLFLSSLSFFFFFNSILSSVFTHVFCVNHPSACSRHLSGHQKASEPRTPRCGWDVRVRSPRDPAEVVLALREAAQGCGCQVHLAGPFLLSCTHGVAGARVAFEAEVCQLPSGLGQSSGVRFKRLWGAPLAFRDIATKVSKELELWGWRRWGRPMTDRTVRNQRGRPGGTAKLWPPLLPRIWTHLTRLTMPHLHQRCSSSDATSPWWTQTLDR